MPRASRSVPPGSGSTRPRRRPTPSTASRAPCATPGGRRRRCARGEQGEDWGAGASGVEEAVGELLFAVVALARKLRVNPEQALRGRTMRFARRFRALEARARARGRRPPRSRRGGLAGALGGDRRLTRGSAPLSNPGLRPSLPAPGATSSHSSHTAPGRGSHHPFQPTSRPRQSHHAAPDCSRADRGDLRTRRLRGVRAGGAEPASRRPGERAHRAELVAAAADLGPRARDHRRPDHRLARAAGAPPRVRLPRGAPLRHRAAGQRTPSTGGVSVPLPTFKPPPTPTSSPSPTLPTPTPTAKPVTLPSPTPTPH